jgi:hypothetical protein
VFGVVEKMVTDNRTVTLYNLWVSDYHTYFVGCEVWGFSVWAHNAQYEVEHIGGGWYKIRNTSTNEFVKGTLDGSGRFVPGGNNDLVLRGSGGNQPELQQFANELNQALKAPGTVVNVHPTQQRAVLDSAKRVDPGEQQSVALRKLQERQGDPRKSSTVFDNIHLDEVNAQLLVEEIIANARVSQFGRMKMADPELLWSERDCLFRRERTGSPHPCRRSVYHFLGRREGIGRYLSGGTMMADSIQTEASLSLGSFHLFGSTKTSYESSVRQMLACVPTQYHQALAEVTIWSDSTQGHRIVLYPGSTLSDAEEWLNISIADSAGCSCLFRLACAGTFTTVSIAIWKREKGSALRGLLYLDHLLETASSPQAGVIFLSAYCQDLLISLNLEYLSITREGDVARHIDQQSGIVFPTLFGIFSQDTLQLGNPQRLTAAGITLRQLANGKHLLNVLSIDQLMSGSMVSESAQQVFQTYSHSM